jgi:hypothetical protein
MGGNNYMPNTERNMSASDLGVCLNHKRQLRLSEIANQENGHRPPKKNGRAGHFPSR